MPKINKRLRNHKKKVSPFDDTIEGVPYIAGPRREPFPQLKSRQARNYRREHAAIEANEEYFEFEEPVSILYHRLQKARKEGDTEAEAKWEAVFKKQIARYSEKNQENSLESLEEISKITTSQSSRTNQEHSSESSIDISKMATADLEDNTLLNAHKDATIPSVIAPENEPYTDRNGNKFLNSTVYNAEPKKSSNDTSLNFTFFNRTTEPVSPIASTPFCTKQNRPY